MFASIRQRSGATIGYTLTRTPNIARAARRIG